MTTPVWKDATRYSHGERGVKAPTAWEVGFGPVRIFITRGHIYHPGEWVAVITPLCARPQPLAVAVDGDAASAQRAALVLTERLLEPYADALSTISEVVLAIDAPRAADPGLS